eukprot:1431-Rhodomonas_salina.1
MGRVSADHGKWPRGCCLRLVARSEQAACVTQVGAGSQPGSNQALSENMGWACFHAPFSVWPTKTEPTRRSGKAARGGASTEDGDEEGRTMGSNALDFAEPQARGCEAAVGALKLPAFSNTPALL